MLIDFHTHIFPDAIADNAIKELAKAANYTPYSNGTESGLREQLKRAKCDIAVVLPVLTKPSQFDGVNRFAKSINEKYKSGENRLLSFGGIHPKCEDIPAKMKFLKENGFLGVKIHPDYQGTFIDDEGYIKILSCAKDLDMVVVTHAGVDDGFPLEKVKCPPVLAKKVIDKVKYNKIVFAHFGGHKLTEEVYDYLAGEDVYFDTAFTFHEINKGIFDKILKKHGEDKILFATDNPWRDIKEDKEIFLSYGYSEKTCNKILYENAMKLLNIGKL